MRPRHQLSADLLATVRERGGVVHRDELIADGIGRSALERLRRTELTDLGTGWFAVGTPTWDGYLYAATQIAGDNAAAYGETAGALAGLVPRSLPLTFLCVGGGPRSRGWVKFVRSPTQCRVIQRNLSPARVGYDDTVLDLATSDEDDANAIAVITRALQSRRTTPERLLDRLAGRRRLPRRRLIRDLLRDAAGIESVLEHRYVHRVERTHGLPAMTRQFVVAATGHRSDGAYADLRALIELDGAAFHDPEADRALDNEHASAGWRTTRFTWDDVEVRACTTARIVAGLLGLAEVPTRCPRCPPS